MKKEPVAKTKSESEMVKKLLTFTPRMNEMVEEIQAEKGYVSFSAVVHAAIIDLHNSCFPKYSIKKTETPEEKVRRKIAEKKVKGNVVREGFVELANRLGGTIVEVEGKEFCVYYTYTGPKRYEQKVPLEMLSSDLVKTQYQPSREKVESLQKAGKTDY